MIVIKIFLVLLIGKMMATKLKNTQNNYISVQVELLKIQNIILLNDAFSNVIRNITTEILETIQKNGILLLIIGIILIIFTITIENIKQYKKEKNKQKAIS